MVSLQPDHYLPKPGCADPLIGAPFAQLSASVPGLTSLPGYSHVASFVDVLARLFNSSGDGFAGALRAWSSSTASAADASLAAALPDPSLGYGGAVGQASLDVAAPGGVADQDINLAGLAPPPMRRRLCWISGATG